ncbi:hypothetical protein EYE35_17340 [Cereibacter sphaeroides]|nr:hypothetical protein EYE35_17340 [Cereibacter sphaeroides]
MNAQRPFSGLEKLHHAIGILQVHYMATDSSLQPEALWGTAFRPDMAVEAAIRLLIEAAYDVERGEVSAARPQQHRQG